MANEHSLTMSLEEFGLSKYEAQAYVTLITKGTISASELAFYSEIPRTKIYPTLLKLEKKKLVIVSQTKPITCTPIAPEDAFDEIIHEQINKVTAMNSLIDNLKKASEESRRTRGSEERRYVQLSPNNVLQQLQNMIDGTGSSVRIMADQWGLEFLTECRDKILSALRRGVEIKVIIPPAHIGSKPFKLIPDGVEIRASEVAQNCFIFDGTQLLVVDGANGSGVIFSSAGILGGNQEKVFAGLWKDAISTRAMADMTEAEAHEIYRIIKMTGDSGLAYMMDSAMASRSMDFDMLGFLEQNGIVLGSRPIDDVVEMMDAILQITCSGRVVYEPGSMSMTVESGLDSGHSLPWVAVLDKCLQKQGYGTRTVFQNAAHGGQKAHIKISKKLKSAAIP